MQREGKQERKCCCQAPAFTQPWFYLQSWCNNLNFSSPSVFARCWQVPGHTGGSSGWALPTEQRCPGSCAATGAPPGSSLLFSLAWEGATARTFTHLMFLCILKKIKRFNSKSSGTGTALRDRSRPKHPHTLAPDSLLLPAASGVRSGPTRMEIPLQTKSPAAPRDTADPLLSHSVGPEPPLLQPPAPAAPLRAPAWSRPAVVFLRV